MIAVIGLMIGLSQDQNGLQEATGSTRKSELQVEIGEFREGRFRVLLTNVNKRPLAIYNSGFTYAMITLYDRESRVLNEGASMQIQNTKVRRVDWLWLVLLEGQQVSMDVPIHSSRGLWKGIPPLAVRATLTLGPRRAEVPDFIKTAREVKVVSYLYGERKL